MKKALVFGLSFLLTAVSLTSAQDLEANKRLQQRLFLEVWNQKALNVVEEIYSPDFVGHPSQFNVPDLAGGHAAQQKRISERLVGFPDLQYTIEDQIAEGNMVVARLTQTGTHSGVFNGLPATGKKVVYTGILWSKVVNGKMVESWNYFDDLGAYQQLGVLPATRTDYNWGYPRQAGNGKPQDPAFNKNIHTRLFNEVWNQGRLDVVDEIYWPDYKGTYANEDGTPYFKQYVTANRTAFPDMQFTVLDQVAEGDMVASRYVCSGTHKGAFMGIKPTNRKVTMIGLSLNRIQDGKIAQSWNSIDMLSVLQTLTKAGVEEWEELK